MEGLRKLLGDLRGLIPKNGEEWDAQGFSDPTALVKDITATCEVDVLESELRLCVAVLFDTDKGIIPFVREATLVTVKNMPHFSKEVAEAHKESLNCIEVILNRCLKRNVSISDTLAVDLATELFRVFKMGGQSRDAAVDPLRLLLLLQSVHEDDHVVADVEEGDETVPIGPDRLVLNKIVDTLAKYLLDWSAENEKKANFTSKGAVLQLLGVISEYFPGAMMAGYGSRSRCSDRLLVLVLSALKQMKSKNRAPPQRLIAGALDSLKSLLQNFGEVVERRQEVFEYLIMALDDRVLATLKVYSVPLAGLRLLAMHSVIFGEDLLENHERMYRCLHTICLHHNRELRRAGYPAMDSFLAQIAQSLNEKDRDSGGGGARMKELREDAFRFFVEKFVQALYVAHPSGTTQNLSAEAAAEVAIAVRGVGYWAEVSHLYMKSDELNKLVARVISASQAFLSDMGGTYEDSMAHLPSFLHSFAGISAASESVNDALADALGKLVSVVFFAFPRLVSHRRVAVYYGVVDLFSALYGKDGALESLLSRSFLQGLVLTCSNADFSSLSVDEDQDETPTLPPDATGTKEAEDVRLFRHYQYLWRAMVSPRFLKQAAVQRRLRRLPAGQELQSVVFDKLVESVLAMLRTLDLRYHVAPDEADPTTTVVSAEVSPSTEMLLPLNAKDYSLFLNLVEFVQAAFPQIEPSYVLRWVLVLGRECVALSNDHPLTSGFYRLLAVVFRTCARGKYFAGMLDAVHEQREGHLGEEPGPADAMDVDDEAQQSSKRGGQVLAGDSDQNRQLSLSLFRRFVSETLVRSGQYSGELLSAVIDMALAVPVELVVIPELVPALETAFRLGVSYSPLANAALDALDHWLQALPSNQLLPALSHVLPVLGPYLRLPVHAEEAVELATTERASKSKYKAKQAGSGQKEGDDNEIDPEIRWRVLRLLGRVGGYSNYLLGNENATVEGKPTSDSPSEYSVESAIAWDTKERIAFELSFSEVKIEIFLDSLLPRIVELALSAPERPTKVAACELLHAVTLHMVAVNAFKDASARVDFASLYQHVFPALLRLAVDVEQVARQLFEPLLFQVVRWFTKQASAEGAGTRALLDAVMDGLSNPKDGGLRLVAAKAVAEFVKWSLKHQTRESDPLHVRPLLQRLSSLARHPSPYRRLGAALGLNHIYRLIREERGLVIEHGLGLLHVALQSLRLAHSDSPSLGTRTELSRAVSHWTGVVEKWAKDLRLPNEARAVQFECRRDLSAFVAWLFQETGRIERAYRRSCMRAFLRLVRQIHGVKTAAEWIQDHAFGGAEEEGFVAPPQALALADVDALTFVSEDPSLSLLGRSFRRSLAILESGCDWLYWICMEADVGVSMDTPELQPFVRQMTEACVAFVKERSLECTAVLLRSFESESGSDVAAYRAAKCNAVIAVLRLAAARLVGTEVGDDTRMGQANSVLLRLVKERTWHRLLVACALHPGILRLPSSPGVASRATLERPDSDWVAGAVGVGFNAEDRPSEDYVLAAGQDGIGGITSHVIQALLAESQRLQGGLLSAVSKAALAHPSAHPTGDLGLHCGDSRASTHPAGFHVVAARDLLRGYKVLHTIGLLEDALPLDRGCPELADCLVQSVLHLAAAAARGDAKQSKPSPSELEIGRAMLDLALILGADMVHLITSEEQLRSARPREQFRATGDEKDAMSPGILLYEILRDAIDLYFIRHSAELMTKLVGRTRQHPFLLRVLGNLIDRVLSSVEGAGLDSETVQAKKRRSRSGRISSEEAVLFLKSLLPHFGAISRAWLEERGSGSDAVEHATRGSAFLAFFRKLVACADAVRSAGEPCLVLDPQQAWFDAVLQPYVSMLARTSVPSLRVEALQLLPAFLEQLGDEAAAVKDVLRPKLEEMISYDAGVVGITEGLFQCLASCDSLVLLDVLFPNLKGDDPLVRSALDSFVRRLNAQRKHRVAAYCFDLFSEVSAQPQSAQFLTVAVYKICIPLLLSGPPECTIEIFAKYIKNIVKWATEDMKVWVHLGRVPRERRAADLALRGCAFALLEALYRAVELSIIRDRINPAYMGQLTVEGLKGNELTVAVMKSASAVTRKPLPAEILPYSEKGEAAGGVPLSRSVAEYHAAAYGALVAAISTQTKEQLFSKFLFSENPAKDEYLWSNIIDIDQVFEFEVETGFGVAQTSIGSLKAAARQREGASVEEGAGASVRKARGGGVSLRYISSLFLAGSSFSQGFESAPLLAQSQLATDDGLSDAGSAASASLDRTDSVTSIGSNIVVGSLNVAGASFVGSVAGGPGREASGRAVGQEELELEMDHINCVPGMVPAIRAVDAVLKKFPIEEGNTVMPAWMQAMHQAMCAPGQHPNVLLFLAKVVVNRPQVFQKFSQFWLEPLIRLICLKDDHVKGHGLHYVLRDVCLTMLSWRNASLIPPKPVEGSAASTAPSQPAEPSFLGIVARSLCSELRTSHLALQAPSPLALDPALYSLASDALAVLMKLAAHQQRSVLRSNLDILKLLVEWWGGGAAADGRPQGGAHVGKDVLLSFLVAKPKDPKDERTMCVVGLQLLGLVCASGLAAYDETLDSHVPRKDYLRAILDPLASSKHKEVCTTVAMTAGLMLRQDQLAHQGHFSSVMEEFKGMLDRKIEAVFQQLRFDRFLNVLYRISESHRGTVAGHLSKIVRILPSMAGEFKVIALQLVCQCLELGDAAQLLKDLQRLISSLLADRDDAVQLVTLQIALRLLPYMKNSQIEQWLLHSEVLSSMVKHRNVEVRAGYYTILKWLFDNVEGLREHAGLSRGLVQGLGDPSTDVREDLRRFWDDASRLPLPTVERVKRMLSSFFSPGAEGLFLGNACYLLLRLASRSVDFDITIHRSLDGVRPQDMHIDISCDERAGAGMTPLFGPGSISPSLSLSQGSSDSSGGVPAGMVLATQQPIFDATHASFSSAAVSQDPFFAHSQTLGRMTHHSSTLLFSHQPYEVRMAQQQQASAFPASSLGTPASFGAPREAERDASGAGMVEIASSLGRDEGPVRVRRRFARAAPSQIQTWMIQKAIAQKRRRAAYQERARQARGRRVQLFRNYRQGELPDVEIAPKAVIEPLQMLALLDTRTSQTLFSLLFRALQHADLSADSDLVASQATLCPHLVTLLERTTSFSTPVIGTVLGLGLQIEAVAEVLPAEVVGQAALRSDNWHLGILLLESQIRNAHVSAVAPAGAAAASRKRQKVTAGAGRGAAMGPGSTREGWRHLARLYAELGQEDIVRGVQDHLLRHIQQPISGEGGGGEAVSPTVAAAYRSAMDGEREGRFSDAVRQYDAALQGLGHDPVAGPSSLANAGEDAREFYRHSLLCLAKLARWDEVVQRISPQDPPVALSPTQSGQEWMWDADQVAAEAPLGLYVRGALRVGTAFLQNPRDNVSEAEELQRRRSRYFEAARGLVLGGGKGEVMNQLSSTFPLELSLVEGLQGSTAVALDRVRQAFDAFLRDWSALPPHAAALQHQMLLRLQPLVEVEEFLHFSGDAKHFQWSGLERVEELLRAWEDRWPRWSEDTLAWEDVVVGRLVALLSLRRRYDDLSASYTSRRESLGNAALTGIQARLDRCAGGLFRHLADAARIQRNYAAAYAFLGYARQHYGSSMAVLATKSEAGEALGLEFAYSIFQLRYDQAISGSEGGEGGEGEESRVVSDLLSVGRAMQKEEVKFFDRSSAASPQQQLQFLLLKSDVFAKLAEGLRGADAELLASLEDLLKAAGGKDSESKQKKQKGRRTPTSAIGTSSLTLSLRSVAQESLERAVTLSSAASFAAVSGTDTTGDAYVRLALFADDLLRHSEEEKGESKGAGAALLAAGRGEAYVKTVIGSQLEAMKRGSETAIGRFPRLLELIDQGRGGQEAEQAFQRGVEGVPIWMFLRWISWMLAALNESDASPAISEQIVSILVRLAEAYPQAVVYPFDLSAEDFTEAARRAAGPIAHVLKAQTDVVAARRFVAALNLLTYPEHRWKHWTDVLGGELRACAPKNRSAAGKSRIKALWEQALAECFDRSRDSDFGALNQKYAGLLPSKYRAASFADTLANTYTDKMFEGEIGARKLKEVTDSRKKEMQLRDFSKWLSNFEAAAYPNLELPGLYTGQQKPQPDAHVHIVGFADEVPVMQSMRKPKVLRIRGDDEREYKFLIKGGEDIRIDQRVEQLFQMMNNVYMHDPACAQRGLHLRTYQVVPMTKSLGAVEWVPNTIPLRAVVLEEDRKQATPGMDAAQRDMHDWIKSLSSQVRTALAQSQWGPVYRIGVYRQPSHKVVDAFRRIVHRVPWHLLRDGVQALCASPAAYLSIREKFARALAVFNVSSYVIGVGDRHLENFLIDRGSGDLVGIDFGHTFGSATFQLPVPELVPFRLTRQMTAMLRPLDAEALLKHNMIHAMAALRANRALMMSTLDIFTKEPLADWRKMAGDLAEVIGKPAGEWRRWFPEIRLRIAGRKLAGDNCADVMCEELEGSVQARYQSSGHMVTLQDIVRGSKERVRASMPRQALSVADQVACLIDHATDPNVLGRMYLGWAPYA